MSDLRVTDGKGGIRTLTLARPDARNAFDLPLIRDLHAAVDAAADDPDVRGLVLTGAANAFCAGGDVHEMAAHLHRLPDHFRDLTRHHHAVVERLLTVPKPVVTALNGVAAGGGVGLALAGDHRVGTPRARFRTAFLPLGVSPDGGSTWLLPRLAGAAHAQRLIYQNPVVDAAEAQALGLLHAIVQDDLQAAAEQAARDLADLPGEGFARAKHLLLDQAGDADALRAHLEAERAANAASAAHPDVAHRLRAFTTAHKPPGP